MSRRPRKLALKKETLRKLDAGDLRQAAGGVGQKTGYCGGGSQAGATGGCETTDMNVLVPQTTYCYTIYCTK